MEWIIMNAGEHHMSFLGLHFGWIFWIIVAIAIVIIVLLIRQKHTKSKSALDILKDRYAKGEISKEEFERKKKDL
jgi:putative membrane protein